MNAKTPLIEGAVALALDRLLELAERAGADGKPEVAAIYLAQARARLSEHQGAREESDITELFINYVSLRRLSDVSHKPA